jgi:hypothetical protein
MQNNPKWKPESKLLAVLDQALSSGMSFTVMYLVANSYSLTIIAVLSLVGNISYSYATISKSQLLYSSLLHSRDSDENDQPKETHLLIPGLQFSLVSTVAMIVFWISMSAVNSTRISFQMVVFFIGVLLTDYFRNVLIHQGLRIVSAQLNLLSVLLLFLFLVIRNVSPVYVDLISFWAILQFVFPLYVIINFKVKKVKFLKRMRNEKLTGRYFFIEASFSRLTMLLGSLYTLFSDSELAGTLAISYLIFAAFPSLITSALQPISNQLVIKGRFGKAFESVVISTYVSHVLWLFLFSMVLHFKSSWFPSTFLVAQEWCFGIMLSSMATAFLNLYQIRMLSDLGPLIFLRVRIIAAIFTGPVGAVIVVNSNVVAYSLYCLLFCLLLNPIVYQKYLTSRFFSNPNSGKEN